MQGEVTALLEKKDFEGAFSVALEAQQAWNGLAEGRLRYTEKHVFSFFPPLLISDDRIVKTLFIVSFLRI